MDTTTFDTLTHFITAATTRRSTLRGLVTGAAATVIGSGFLHADETTARHKRKKRKGDTTPPPPPENACKERNWCVDRSQTCGPTSGHGKCLVEATGGNLCAEILFQANSCADCAAPNCTTCQCVLAAGGGDRCNNGANGFDFICVRAI